VTEVLYTGRSEISGGLSSDAAAWGVTLMVTLAALGTLVLGALLTAARNLRRGETLLHLGILEGLRSLASIGAWGLISTALLVPAAILVLVFPALISL
jgi:hypothetical protein